MDEQLIGLGAQLAGLMARNSATFIADRMGAAKARNDKDQIIAELQEIVQSLINDKNEAVQIAQAYESELVAKRITDEEITYITSTATDLVARMSALSAGGSTPLPPESEDLLKDFLRPETLTVLQTLGFDYRAAIGEPLTAVVRSFIRRLIPTDESDQYELVKTMNEAEIMRHRTAQNAGASSRYLQLTAESPDPVLPPEGASGENSGAQRLGTGASRQQPKRRTRGRG